MNRMMIVDDEPIAADYLAAQLKELPQLKLTYTVAYSGVEALEKLETDPIDILLTDIRMPGMNGMELADHVLARWPRCRVIFLTGYDDFAYAQTAIRKGGVDYVLKTEGDESIVRAIEKAADAIASELNHDHILRSARQQIRLALPIMRRDYMVELLHGEAASAEARRSRFAELEVPLDPQLPPLAAVGRVDEWGSFAQGADKPLLLYALDNIAAEYFAGKARFLPLQIDRARFVWLLQPLAEGGEQAQRLLEGGAEFVQSAAKRLLKVTLSLSVGGSPAAWEELAPRVEALKLQLSSGGIGRGKEMLLIEPPGDPAAAPPQSSKRFFAENDLRANMRKLDLFEAHLDNGEAEAFAGLFDDLFAAGAGLLQGSGGKLLAMELFAHLSAFFLAYWNKRKLLDKLGPLLTPEALADWQAGDDAAGALGRFREFGMALAAYNGRRQNERTNDIIGRIHQYVQQYLHEELSLTRLSELVHLSPPYLSRVYKQMTGQGLLEYITQTRINKARLLLKTTDRKIQDIAAMIGLDSAPYFTRLFKKETGYTPQEYRESALAAGE
ncbi:response regulator transcription factor [Paenibacillus cymbidii]|uniref:response regulator transcription factor n=1 Tax=Paenibacillus cymbidii TaxID=1639034 RepID=UPI00143674F0|nr:response regulator [Paenibacillus cymbidii]